MGLAPKPCGYYRTLSAVYTAPYLHSSEIYDFDLTEQGKTLYSIGRWVSPTGKKGPWLRIGRVVIP
jgi:hypothetical protein